MNYYHILEVSDGASELDIKRSFRMKLKRLHPDSSAFHEGDDNNQKESTFREEQNLVEVITAYTVLSNPVKRRYYDACIERHHDRTTSSRDCKKRIFNYEQFLLRRFHTFKYKAKFFLYDLVFNDGSRAAKVYEEIEYNNTITLLQKTLGRHDFFDCLFLLAEYYQYNAVQTNPLKSLQLYDGICRLELATPYFKSYMDEVGHRVLEIMEDTTFDIDFIPEKYNNIVAMFSIMVEWQISAVMKKSMLRLLRFHSESREITKVMR